MTIYCPNCGKSVSSDYQFCPYCGASLQTNGGYAGNNSGGQGNFGFPPPPFQQNGTRTRQPQQGGWPFPNGNSNQNAGTGSTIGSNRTLGCIASIASFLIPLVGIVIYFMYRNRDIQTAKRMLYIALAGLAFNLLVNVIGIGSRYSYFHGLYPA